MMCLDEEKKRVIERIMKVYNKSTNNPSQEEAKLAVLKVQEMLAKYNLSLNDIKGENAAEEVKKFYSGKKQRWWHKTLGLLLAKNFRCKVYTLTSCGDRIVFLGLETDAAICLETFEYVKKAINYNCKLHMSKRRLRNKENIKVAKESFIEGFLNGLNVELKRQKNCNEWAVVLSIPAVVEAIYNNIEFTGTSISERSTSKKSDERAFQEGYIIGSELNISLEKKGICST